MLILAEPVPRRAAYSYYVAVGVVVWCLQARRERPQGGSDVPSRPDLAVVPAGDDAAPLQEEPANNVSYAGYRWV